MMAGLAMRTEITNSTSAFSDSEKGLLEQAFQLRESQTEEQRASMRAEFELNWPALVA